MYICGFLFTILFYICNNMIHLVVGKQGSGKTVYVVKKAYDYYKQGKTIYSNVDLKFPYKLLDYDDIINCRLDNAMVIIDEAHQLLGSRSSMSRINNEITTSFISMVRKKNLDLFLTTQHERKIDARIREMEMDYFYLCTRYAFIKGEWKEVLHNQDVDKNTPINIKIKVIEVDTGTEIIGYFRANPYFKMYDTRQIIRIKGLKI